MEKTLTTVRLPGFRGDAFSAAQDSALPLQLTGAEYLRILSANSLTGVRIVVRGRFVQPDGTATWLKFDHTPATDRSVRTSFFNLGRSVLTNLICFAEGTAPVSGQTFVQCALTIGNAGDVNVLGALIQGYVTSNVVLAWPGSPIQSSLDGGGYYRSFLGSNPAPGVGINEVCPTGARWELVSLFVAFATSAAAGNRVPILELTTPVGPSALVPSPVVVPPLANVNLSWLAGNPHDTAADPTIILTGCAPGQPILAGTAINTPTQNMDAFDLYFGPVVTVREWIEL